MGRVLALHVEDPGSIPGILYGPLSQPGVIPKCKVTYNP